MAFEMLALLISKSSMTMASSSAKTSPSVRLDGCVAEVREDGAVSAGSGETAVVAKSAKPENIRVYNGFITMNSIMVCFSFGKLIMALEYVGRLDYCCLRLHVYCESGWFSVGWLARCGGGF